MERVKLEDILKYEQPSKYIVNNTSYNDNYKTPVLTAGKTFLLGNTNEDYGIYTDLPCIIFDDFTTTSKYVNFPFKVKSSAMKILTTNNNDINLKFIFFLMQTIKVDTQTHKRFWISEYSKIEIPLPPLKDQQKIVEKLEELFSELDKGIEELTEAKERLKIYRQAVLKSAFEGEFKHDNRCPCMLTDSIKNEKLLSELPRIPNEWKYVYLSNLGDLGRGKSKHRPRNDEKLFVDGKYPFIQTGDVKKATYEITEYSQMYGDFGLKQSKLWIKGTLCITIAANIAETAFLGMDACFPDSIVGFTPAISKINAKYIKHFLEASKVRLSAFAPATAQKNINLTTLENLVVPYCNLVEQNYIVQEIEEKLSICDNIEKNIENQLVKAESLRQSILKKAFEGGFTNV